MENREKNSILIVDDEITYLETLTILLESDYLIYKADNGLSAIKIANKLMPDLILLDIIMPGMTGYEVLEELKKSKKTKNIPVVILTGLDSTEEEEKGLALSAADFIVKPFKPKILKLRVSNQIQIVNQIHEIKKYTREAAASEERSKFFARMSHEMRTPLNAVLGLSGMVLDEDGISDSARENIEKISVSGAHLLGLVNEVLDISKIESGNFKLVPVEYDTAAMISAATNQSIVYKGEKPIDFIISIDENLPSRLFGDDKRIEQILINLLSNAFKYTKEGSVELRIKSELSKDDTAILSAEIIDTGIGIENEILDKLFSDYVQADLKSNNYTEGTGLGLSITKMITDMMGGKISVKSEYGKGSVFSVELPQKLIDSKAIGKEAVSGIKSFNYIGKNKRARVRRTPMPYARILVVDDVVYNLDVAKGMLKPYKIQVDCVTSGQSAIDAIRQEKVKYDAIFMDHMMPDIDGIEALQIIREEIGTEYAKTIPVIAFTANALTGNKEMFLDKGFQAFISKPIDSLHLDNIINQWVRDEEQDKLYKEEAECERRSGKDRRKYGQKPAGFMSAEIEGVDLHKGLERFKGDIEIFMDTMQSFTVNTKQLLEKIKSVSRDNLKDYAIHIHGVKSSCRGICAFEMGDRAEDLEKAAKADDLDYVTKNNSSFIEDLFLMIANIEAALADGCGIERAKLKKDKPYKEALQKLKTACENYQIEEVEAAIKEIECFEYTADDGLALKLRENVNLMNYMEIAEELAGVLQD
ncbi:MAG: response regulator [Treponema sp.]|jgi:signal transduction histidine kinase|nr:response regulator [Treponema sp.]